MNARRVRKLLWGASATVAALGVAVILWLPASVGETQIAAVRAPVTSAGDAAGAGGSGGSGGLPPIERFRPVWSKDLRQSLVPRAPEPVVRHAPQPEPPPPPLRVTLLGIATERDAGGRKIPGGEYVVLQKEGGDIEVRRVGERVDGAEILEISDERVVLDHRGRRVTLALPQTSG